MAAKLLKFQELILQEALDSQSRNGLWILAKGIGMKRILSALLLHYRKCEKLLVIVLNVNPALLPDETLKKSVYVTSEFLSKQRESIYLAGGVVFVTNRIFVVDFLLKRVPSHLIAGFVVGEASQVLFDATTAFILRLFRRARANQPHLGFVKAFSEKPKEFSLQFGANLQRAMKLLYVSQVHLWPRFQECVKETLSSASDGNTVISLYASVTPLVSRIHQHILSVSLSIINEISTTTAIDISGVFLNQSKTKLNPSFHKIIRSQLDRVWHSTSQKIRQLVSDLGNLSNLLSLLLVVDCVTFYRYLETMRRKDLGVHSAWMFTDDAHHIFELSKHRLYTKRRDVNVAEDFDVEESEEVDELELDPEKRYKKKRKVASDEMGVELVTEILDDAETLNENNVLEKDIDELISVQSDGNEMEVLANEHVHEITSIGMTVNGVAVDSDISHLNGFEETVVSETSVLRKEEKSKGDMDDLLSFADGITITIPTDKNSNNSNSGGNVITLNTLAPNNTNNSSSLGSNTSRLSPNSAVKNKLARSGGIGLGSGGNIGNGGSFGSVATSSGSSGELSSNNSNGNDSPAPSGFGSLKRRGSGSFSGHPVMYQPTLEANPKWTTLDEILKEIRSRPIPKREKNATMKVKKEPRESNVKPDAENVIVIDDEEDGVRAVSSNNSNNDVTIEGRKKAISTTGDGMLEDNATNDRHPSDSVASSQSVKSSEFQSALKGLAQQLDALDDDLSATVQMLQETAPVVEEGNSGNDTLEKLADLDEIMNVEENVIVNGDSSCNFPASSKNNNNSNPSRVEINREFIDLENPRRKVEKSSFGVTPESEFCNVLLIVKDDMALNQVTNHLKLGKEKHMKMKFCQYIRSKQINASPEQLPVSEKPRYGAKGKAKAKSSSATNLSTDTPIYRNNVEINDFFNDFLRENDQYTPSVPINLLDSDGGEQDFQQYFGLFSPFDFYETNKNDTTFTSESKNNNNSGIRDRTENVGSNETIGAEQEEPTNSSGVFPLILVHSLQNGFPSLDEIRPLYIILYDYNVNFLRNIECYKVENRGTPLQVYMMIYENTIEEYSFLQSTATEKQCFASLIQEKARIVPTFEQEGQPVMDELIVDHASSLLDEAQSSTAITLPKSVRKGGAIQVANEKRTLVLVDMREFRSKLPSILDELGLAVHPVVLAVGDFVLSPELCIERKSYYDLIDSFQSGRLFQQTEMMTRSYANPILLIEFDEKQSFCLNDHIPDQFSASHLSSKLVVLTRAYPKLRILWSRSPRESAMLFVKLKESCSGEPVIPKEDESSLSLHMDSHLDAIDVLLSMPGVTTTNYIALLDQITTLRDLYTLTRAQLIEIMGEKSGTQLHQFLNAKMSFAGVASGGKSGRRKHT